MNNFQEKVRKRILDKHTVLCIGLDTIVEKMHKIIQYEKNPQFFFNRRIIDATNDLVCCYKPNLAFYTAYGTQGLEALKQTIKYAHSFDIPVILDAKFGDIGHTAEYYARTAFDMLDADAVTLNPYMGKDSITPFQSFDQKTSFILCFTSNQSRMDFQTQSLMGLEEQSPLYLNVAQKIREWNSTENLGAVVGATAPEELKKIRKILGDKIPILCPGVGAQGGDLEEVLWAGRAQRGGLIVNASRAILYASDGPDFDKAARCEAEMFVNQVKAFFSQAPEEQVD